MRPNGLSQGKSSSGGKSSSRASPETEVTLVATSASSSSTTSFCHLALACRIPLFACTFPHSICDAGCKSEYPFDPYAFPYMRSLTCVRSHMRILPHAYSPYVLSPDRRFPIRTLPHAYGPPCVLSPMRRTVFSGLFGSHTSPLMEAAEKIQ